MTYGITFPRSRRSLLLEFVTTSAAENTHLNCASENGLTRQGAGELLGRLPSMPPSQVIWATWPVATRALTVTRLRSRSARSGLSHR